jgi:two-component system sensor histidine kinase CpxA
VKIKNRIALSTALIVATMLTAASSLIYWNVWREDQGGNFESTTQSLLTGLFLLVSLGTISSFFLGLYLSKRALNPVQDLIHQVEQATEGSRVQASNPADDIGKIALSLNGLLDRLQASSANQKRFTADAGHELRGPLTTMQLSIDALRATHDSKDLRDISTEIGRLAKLCNDLLDLSRVDNQEIQRSEHRLIEIIEEELRTFGGQDKRIAVHLDESINQSVICNRLIFGLAVRNLLENAFQFAKSEIKVSGRQDIDGLHVIIKDDGPGVPILENENIFERFYRSEKVRTIGKGGTGLGLSVVSAAMEAHGGKAFSIPGEAGGEFHLLLI